MGKLNSFTLPLRRSRDVSNWKKKIDSRVDLILHATVKLNRTIHSVTNQRSIGIIHFSSEDAKERVKKRLANIQLTSLRRNNTYRQNRTFKVEDTIMVKNNKRIGNKLTPFNSEEIVEADLGTIVLIKGCLVHKDNLR